ncbi:unnamed protein product [Adineta ricciae]|uniref:TIR domain-containing protein n=1 Tax=Adineta ricciae TaxID=249248 RepID=A0A815MXG5_ADIRI|nr:unnamed protein product [Adineta ricciae]
MDQSAIVEDIISTKNTMTILHRIYSVNHNSLQQFSSIFDLITELIDICTRSSVKQLESVVKSNESESIFNKLNNILDKLSDAITTKNTSAIDSLNDQLLSCVETFRLCSSHRTNNEETADSLFKKQLTQSHTNDLIERSSSERDLSPESNTDHKRKKTTSSFSNAYTDSSDFLNEEIFAPAPPPVPMVEIEKAPKANDYFSQFRFARKPIRSSAIEEDENASVSPSSSVSTNVLSTEKSTPSKPRLMISYNHGSKSLCVEIYNNLTNDGYRVWIDQQEMHGSTLIAMAQAIEESDIVIYCMTEKYSESRNCQKEAEYAFVRQKIMIPLLLQSKYKPTGWLGLILGADFYIDFTKNEFIQNYQKLKSEIESHAMRMNKDENNDVKPILSSNTDDPKPDPPPLQSVQTKPNSSEKESRSCVLL